MSDFGSHTQWKAGDNIDDIVLKYIVDNFNIKTMIDIGCGRGKQVESARIMGVNAIGVDGSTLLGIYDKAYFIQHDYTVGKLDSGHFDLAWSVEFLEHVYEKYIPNFLDTFSRCNLVFCTHGVPGQRGTHHVNCQKSEYWMDIFNKNGFEYDIHTTMEIRSIAENKFIKYNGLFFKK